MSTPYTNQLTMPASIIHLYIKNKNEEVLSTAAH